MEGETHGLRRGGARLNKGCEKMEKEEKEGTIRETSDNTIFPIFFDFPSVDKILKIFANSVKV